jgi:hypothetical protein
MNKRDLYKKYVETFGFKATFLDVIIKLGALGMRICYEFLGHDEPLNFPLHISEEMYEDLADAQIAIEIILRMNEGNNQGFLTQKHYLLNEMDTAIWNKEKKNETISD